MKTIGATLLLLFATTAVAQDFEAFAGAQIRFDAPGARALSMGGATTALDDVFGPATNPASIAGMKRTFAMEARRTSNETEHVIVDGNAFGRTSLESSNSRLSNATLVLPSRTGTFAFFYDRPIDAAADTRPLPFRTIALGIVPGAGFVPVEQCAVNCYVRNITLPLNLPIVTSLAVQRYGAAYAWKNDRFAGGVSLRYESMDERADALALDGTPVFVQRANDNALSWSAGAQARITDWLRAGAAYRSGAAFDAERSARAPLIPYTRIDQLHTPASYSAGLAVDVRNLTISADATRVEYSSMLESVRPIMETPTTPQSNGFEIPDVTEFRAGAEYRINDRVAVRAGWWRDPSHRMRTTAANVFESALLDLALIDEDENHITAGIGIGNERLRVDAGFDRGGRSTRASLSLATTF